MSIRNGWPAVSGAADQYDIRAALRATIAQDATGRIKTGAAVTSTSLTMLVTARQDMAVDLQPSDWVLDRRGPVCLSVDGVETIHLAPAPSANSRVDTVWIMQRETQAPIGDNADGPLAGITTGVPGISPVAPALTDGQLAVADILIPSTATNTSSDGVVITQRAPYTTMQGGLLRFRSPTDLNLWKPVDGQRARLQDGTEYVGSGGVWVSQTNIEDMFAPGQWASDYTIVKRASIAGRTVILDLKVTRVKPSWTADGWAIAEILRIPAALAPRVSDFTVPAAGNFSEGPTAVGFTIGPSSISVRPIVHCTISPGSFISASICWDF